MDRPPTPKLKSATEVAQAACVSRMTVSRALNSGHLEGAVRVGKTWVIPAKTAEQYVQKLKKTTSAL